MCLDNLVIKGCIGGGSEHGSSNGGHRKVSIGVALPIPILPTAKANVGQTVGSYEIYQVVLRSSYL